MGFLHGAFICFSLPSDRYEEAREEEKLRNQREDFSDMVAEVHCSAFLFSLVIFSCSFASSFPLPSPPPSVCWTLIGF